MSRVGVLIATGSSASALNRREVENAASKLGLEPVIAEVREVNDLENAFTTLSRSRVDALYVPGSTMLSAHGASVARLAAKHKLPAMYTSDRFVDAGGLIGYGADINSAIVHASAHVDRILKGAKPGDLPIEQVSKLELIVNLKSAREMDLKIPRSVLLQADRVID
jgi:putative ABC transport system substrate-binding protein